LSAFLENILDELNTIYTKLRQDLEISGVIKIARRYFVMNAFDGALTIFGIIVGSYFSGLKTPTLIIGAGIGACLAMGVSGFFGTFMTERAERIRHLKKIEDAMLTDLGDSELSERRIIASVFAALVDGLSPMLAALGPLLPFYLSFILPISIDLVFIIAIAINTIILFALGAFLGKISRENMLKYGLLMTGTGLLTAVLLLFLQT
jgi:predicted membrane protein (TIGR00267 family)